MTVFRLVMFSLILNSFFSKHIALSAENINLRSQFVRIDAINQSVETNNHDTKKSTIKLSNNFHLDGSYQERNNSSDAPGTIKKNINHALDKIIFNGLRKYGAATAIGIIMNVDTGQVISCSYIESQEISRWSTRREYDDIAKISEYLFQNGSVMKLMTIAKAIDDRKITFSSKIDAKNEFHYKDYQIHDYFGKGKILTLPEVFLYSSNIATARIVQIDGWKNMYDFYSNILFEGFNHNGINYLEKVINPEKKIEFETILASIGHNIYATPLHYVSAVATLVNGGKKISSTFKLGVNKSRKKSIFMHSDTSKIIRKILEMNVVEGTAIRSKVKGYRTGGMTATAEKVIHYEYNSRRVVSSFIGVLPVDEPKYIIMTIYDEPRPEYLKEGYFTAGYNAAPTAASIIEDIAPLLGIKRKNVIKNIE